MIRLFAVSITVLLFAAGCTKEISCDLCGYYTGLSQKVDLLPGSTFGSYTTATVSYKIWNEGKGFRTPDFFFLPDAEGYFYDAPDSLGQLAKGYLTLEVTFKNDSIQYEIHKPGGLSELFEGVKIN